jgi:hypothetical protein
MSVSVDTPGTAAAPNSPSNDLLKSRLFIYQLLPDIFEILVGKTLIYRPDNGSDQEENTCPETVRVYVHSQ